MSNKWHGGKGSKRRPEDSKKYSDNWDKIMLYVAKNKDKGLEWIINKLATKYNITPSVKTKVKKAING